RKRLRIAHRHPKPERRMQLEIEGATCAVLVWLPGWILGQRQIVDRRISAARRVGIKQQRRLIMADAFPVLVVELILGAQIFVMLTEGRATPTLRHRGRCLSDDGCNKNDRRCESK